MKEQKHSKFQEEYKRLGRVKMSWVNDLYGSYTNYLCSDDWKYKRNKMIEWFKVCQKCGTNKKLVVHHLNYDRVPHEKIDDLLVVCFDCHSKIHKGDTNDD